MPLDGNPSQFEPQVQTVSDVLMKAAQIIRKRGWVRAMWVSDAGVCARMAIYGGASGDHTKARPARMALVAFLGLSNESELIRWNDTVCQSAAEATQALEGAALAARKKMEG